MITIGAGETKSRDVYLQDDNYNIEFDFLKTSDDFHIYLQKSGGSEVSNVWFKSSAILDSTFLGFATYDIGSPLTFRVKRSGQYINYFLDNSLKMSFPEHTYYQGEFDNISIYNGGSSELQLNMRFCGRSGDVSFGRISTEDYINFTGIIINNASGTKLLGITGGGSGFSFPGYISAGATGIYSFYSDILNSSTSTSLDFDFDFGKITPTCQVYNPYYSSGSGTGFTDFGMVDSFIEEGGLVNFYFSDYNTDDRNLAVSLDYVKRYGQTYYSGTGYGTGNFSGYINGSGYVESYDMVGHISGFLGSGYGTKFIFASGQVVADFSVQVIGYEAGNLSTGTIWIIATGIVPANTSGYYNFVGNIVSTPIISMWDGGVNLSPTGLYTGSYNFNKNAVQNVTESYAANILMGGSSSDSAMPNIYDLFRLKTGVLSYSGVDYYNNGYFTSSSFSNSVSLSAGEFYDMEGSISYSGSSPGVLDELLLTVSGQNNIISKKIYASYQDLSDKKFVGYIVAPLSGVPTYYRRYFYPSSNTYIDE